MEQDRKTEIVSEHIIEALEDLHKKYGQEITFSFKTDYLNGKIIIRVDA